MKESMRTREWTLYTQGPSLFSHTFATHLLRMHAHAYACGGRYLSALNKVMH